MKRTLIALVSALTLASSAAFAAKGTTEYYFQPAAGASALELRYDMNVMPRQTQNSVNVVTDDKAEVNAFTLDYAYGLNETNTLGATISTGSTKYTVGPTSSTASGMGDFHLYYHGSSDIWHFGADLGISTEKIKNDTITGKQSNRMTGGPSIKAFVGLLMNNASWNYGADLSYLALLEREIDTPGSAKIKDGNVVRLAPFVEYNYGMGYLGAELAYAMVGDTTVGTTKVKGESVTGLTLMGSFDFNEMTTGLLKLGTNMHGSHAQTDLAGSATVKEFTETVASLGVRINF